MTIHHRKARSRGGSDDPKNLVRVPDKKHKAFNLLFSGNPTPWTIAEIINRTWIDGNYKLVVERRL